MGANFITGIAIGIMFTISPLWIGETCRPELRGFWLCFCECHLTKQNGGLLLIMAACKVNTSIIWGQMLV